MIQTFFQLENTYHSSILEYSLDIITLNTVPVIYSVFVPLGKLQKFSFCPLCLLISFMLSNSTFLFPLNNSFSSIFFLFTSAWYFLEVHLNHFLFLLLHFKTISSTYFKVSVCVCVWVSLMNK